VVALMDKILGEALQSGKKVKTTKTG
jgi:hypothetical protein